jgi:hypothetical protein
MGKKRKKIWKDEAERQAWEAQVDEDIRRVRELAEKAWAEIERKRATAPPAPDQ